MKLAGYPTRRPRHHAEVYQTTNLKWSRLSRFTWGCFKMGPEWVLGWFKEKTTLQIVFKQLFHNNFIQYL